MNIMNMVHCEIFSFECNGDLQGCIFYYFQFFPSIINRCTILNGKKGACTYIICNTGCYTVHENAPNIVLVLRC